MKIFIIGAGVGGLVAAHELAKQGHDITIIERNAEIGGQARSRYENGTFAEYCWHAFGNKYNYLYEILKEIPYESPHAPKGASDTKKKSVFDNLRPMNTFNYSGARQVNTTKDFISNGNIFYKLRMLAAMGDWPTLKDVAIWARLIALAAATSVLPAWVRRALDGERYVDWIKGMSPQSHKWAYGFPAIYLGMDIDDLSLYTMLERIQCAGNGGVTFNDMCGPFHKVWFEPWEAHLRARGVKFLLRRNVEHVEFAAHNGCINARAITYTDANGTAHTEKCDLLINALHPEGWAGVLERSQGVFARLLYKDAAALSSLGRQLQTQVVYFLAEPVVIDGARSSIIVLQDTPWFIMIRAESCTWDCMRAASDEHPLGTYTRDSTAQDLHSKSFDPDFIAHQNSGESIKEVWCAGIGLFNVKGLNGKTAAECTPRELIDEAWAQITKYVHRTQKDTVPSRRSRSPIRRSSSTGREFNVGLRYLRANVWHTYKYVNGALSTREPKFSNSVHTLALRPKTRQYVTYDMRRMPTNIYNVGAHVDTATHILCMESAAESGVLAARMIGGESRDDKQNDFIRDDTFIGSALARLIIAVVLGAAAAMIFTY